MIPSKWCLVYLREGHPPALIRVCDVSLIDLSDVGDDGKANVITYINSWYISVSRISNSSEREHKW
jgi:hypothetical protein